MLSLLKLAPAVIEAVVALGDPISFPAVTERKLRKLSLLDEAQQMREFGRLLASRSSRSTIPCSKT